MQAICNDFAREDVRVAVFVTTERTNGFYTAEAMVTPDRCKTAHYKCYGVTQMQALNKLSDHLAYDVFY